MLYHKPSDLDELWPILEQEKCSIIAGGTDWFPSRGEATFGETIIDITRLPGIRGISETDTGWRIGAATTWSDIIKVKLPACFDGLKLSAREVGSIQIQNAGTIAGNICNASPAADGVPPLLTLNASVEVCSQNNTRVVPLSEFITGVRKTALKPGEVVTALVIPPMHGSASSSFLKIGARKYLVISIAMGAAVLEVDEGIIKDARLAVGSCSPVAKRLTSLEHALIGVPLVDAPSIVSAEHLTFLNPIGDVRGSSDYRMEAALTLCRRLLAARSN